MPPELIFAALFILGALAAQATVSLHIKREAKRLKALQAWSKLSAADFKQGKSCPFCGSRASAINLLVQVASSGNRLDQGGHQIYWQGQTDRSGHDFLEATLYFSDASAADAYECIDSASNRIWLRWTISELPLPHPPDFRICLEYLVENEPLNPSEELVFDQFCAEAERRLSELSWDMANLHLPTQLKHWQGQGSLALALASEGIAQQTDAKDLIQATALTSQLPAQTILKSDIGASYHDEWVRIPDRTFEGVNIDQAIEILLDFVSKGGVLREPNGVPAQLVWQSGTINDEKAKTEGIVETVVRFSNYATFFTSSMKKTPELDQELVLKWHFFDQSAAAVHTQAQAQKHPIALGKQIRVVCLWRGFFQQSSGDLVRYMLERLELELEKAGALPTGAVSARTRNRQLHRDLRHLRALERQQALRSASGERQVWPSLQDFNEAIQNPSVSFSDPELKTADLELTAFGLPKVMSGTFASVYKLSTSGKDYAVRCFNSALNDREERYRLTSRFICSDDLVYTVPLYYEDKGILVQGRWYPIIKMEWVKGESLYSYVEKCLQSGKGLSELRERFQIMMDELKAAGIAHSDLQHGNLLVSGEDLVLVDYDGMFVPELSGFRSHELGHPNYQHPERSEAHFGPYLDNFSAWVIDTSFLSLQLDQELWAKFGGDGESLLFKRSDFEHPLSSPLFAELLEHPASQIKERARYLLYLLESSPERIPFLDGKQLPDLLSGNLEQANSTDSTSSQLNAGSAPSSSEENPSAGFPDWMR